MAIAHPMMGAGASMYTSTVTGPPCVTPSVTVGSTLKANVVGGGAAYVDGKLIIAMLASNVRIIDTPKCFLLLIFLLSLLFLSSYVLLSSEI